eukprot:CAMPEP_0174247992 /NCGR_PEP_ID=MMETSP0417-20130205/42853_1 /TAXON_ID=242541 /ORGANISM="Mayorella sp, Strain BSH-02190019" /LENGTH=1283 /DNA_ID=CAMNT_0015327853 /DNA_START=178 /DNA_END=4026 /DNA_ORIENTATION=-
MLGRQRQDSQAVERTRERRAQFREFLIASSTEEGRIEEHLLSNSATLEPDAPVSSNQTPALSNLSSARSGYTAPAESPCSAFEPAAANQPSPHASPASAAAAASSMPPPLYSASTPESPISPLVSVAPHRDPQTLISMFESLCAQRAQDACPALSPRLARVASPVSTLPARIADFAPRGSREHSHQHHGHPHHASTTLPLPKPPTRGLDSRATSDGPASARSWSGAHRLSPSSQSVMFVPIPTQKKPAHTSPLSSSPTRTAAPPQSRALPTRTTTASPVERLTRPESSARHASPLRHASDRHSPSSSPADRPPAPLPPRATTLAAASTMSSSPPPPAHSPLPSPELGRAAHTLQTGTSPTHRPGPLMLRRAQSQEAGLVLAQSPAQERLTPVSFQRRSPDDPSEIGTSLDHSNNSTSLDHPRDTSPRPRDTSPRPSEDSGHIRSTSGSSRRIGTTLELVPPATRFNQVVAAYDMPPNENKDLLSFSRGDLILALRQQSAQWWLGALNGRVGLFPMPYMIAPPRATLTNAAPPAPDSEATSSGVQDSGASASSGLSKTHLLSVTSRHLRSASAGRPRVASLDPSACYRSPPGSPLSRVERSGSRPAAQHSQEQSAATSATLSTSTGAPSDRTLSTTSRAGTAAAAPSIAVISPSSLPEQDERTATTALTPTRKELLPTPPAIHPLPPTSPRLCPPLVPPRKMSTDSSHASTTGSWSNTSTSSDISPSSSPRDSVLSSLSVSFGITDDSLSLSMPPPNLVGPPPPGLLSPRELSAKSSSTRKGKKSSRRATWGAQNVISRSKSDQGQSLIGHLNPFELPDSSVGDDGVVEIGDQHGKLRFRPIGDTDKVLIGGTFNRLVGWFLLQSDETISQNDDIQAFFMTYRMTQSASTLLETITTTYKEWSGKRGADTLKKHLFWFLLEWMERWSDWDFWKNDLFRSFLKFTSKVFPQDQANVFKLHFVRLQAKKATPSRSIVSTGDVDVSFRVKDLSINQTAEQLTLIEADLFCAINPIEFVYHVVPPNGTPKEEHSPNLHAISTHFNKVSLWVATEVVTARTPREQASIWKRFIKLAKRLRELNNFNTLMQVISGLGNAATQRLKQARGLLSPKLLSQLAQLEEIFLPTQNFQNYRSAIHAASPPILPYLAMYLRDLTYISDGNSTYLAVLANDPQLLLNWEKQRLFWEHVQRLRTYFPDGRNPYMASIQPDRLLRSYLLNLKALDDENLYNHSRIMNPIVVREEVPATSGGGLSPSTSPRSGSGSPLGVKPHDDAPSPRKALEVSSVVR